MSGTFSVGGLISGLDTNSIISQLVQIERQPITRIQQRIATFQAQQTAIGDLRTQLLTLRNRAQDFQLNSVFGQFMSTSSETGIVTSSISGENPVLGAYAINVTQLASATVATSNGVLGAAINPGAALDSSGINGAVTAGTFTVNGVEFTVDPATDSLNSILSAITASAAGVNASYDAATDKVVLANKTAGDTSIINLGVSGDTSNLLSVLNVTGATQFTNGSGSTELTSTRNLGAVNPGAELHEVSFAGGAMTSGSFSINGVSITIDVTADSLSDVISRINQSGAAVTASYDSSTDTIRMVSKNLGSRTISFASGTSNFLDMTNLTTATQTAGSDAQFTVNGGPVQTRNTNTVTDAIGGITLNLLSLGTSTVTVSGDEDATIEGMQTFVDEVNSILSSMHTLLGRDGTLENDVSLRIIQNYVRDTMLSQVSGGSGEYQSLVDIGLSTGETFDASAATQFSFNEETLRAALQNNPGAVESLFTNSDGTGIADRLFDYLDTATGTSGFLNQRARSNGIIDQQISSLNDQITRIEERVEKYAERLRLSFSRMEQYQSQIQSMNTVLSSLGSVSLLGA